MFVFVDQNVNGGKFAEIMKKEHLDISRDIENLKKDVLNFEEMFLVIAVSS